MKKLLLITLIIPFISVEADWKRNDMWQLDAEKRSCHVDALGIQRMWTRGSMEGCAGNEVLIVQERVNGEEITDAIASMLGVCPIGSLRILRDRIYVDPYTGSENPEFIATCNLQPIEKWKAWQDSKSDEELAKQQE